MQGNAPVWHARNGCMPQRRPEPKPEPPAEPPQPAGLPELLQHSDPETLLLAGLLLLLWREGADKKLLLALAYILL